MSCHTSNSRFHLYLSSPLHSLTPSPSHPSHFPTTTLFTPTLPLSNLLTLPIYASLPFPNSSPLSPTPQPFFLSYLSPSPYPTHFHPLFRTLQPLSCSPLLLTLQLIQTPQTLPLSPVPPTPSLSPFTPSLPLCYLFPFHSSSPFSTPFHPSSFSLPNAPRNSSPSHPSRCGVFATCPCRRFPQCPPP